ncbi:hypothetical protein PoB_000256000 [Plakobranchus ocellatus]|uniref:Uncharacterized protein n=1 Tax=Plakobranchus ocellatus TaxID=259542 RepID=A0AAV3XYZ6_9GAST|nr:hypothetical protein PoB_000256000 [Plakobranchus ocellatus]
MDRIIKRQDWQPTYQQEFTMVLVRISEEIPQRDIRHLAFSLQLRCAAVINSGSRQTRYLKCDFDFLRDHVTVLGVLRSSTAVVDRPDI